MIDTKNCYSMFTGKAEVIPNYFSQHQHKLSYIPLMGWSASPVPEEIYLQEPVLKEINSQFNIARAGILRMDSNRCYKWHVDFYRGVTINLLLTPEQHSHCYFGDAEDEYQEQFNFIELKYTKNDFYLFNTEVVHTVLNYDEPRYLFSVEFSKHKHELKYEEIREWATDKGLL